MLFHVLFWKEIPLALTLQKEIINIKKELPILMLCWNPYHDLIDFFLLEIHFFLFLIWNLILDF